MGGDLLRIVEAAYAMEPDLRAWLDGIVDAARPFDTGGGIVSYLLRFEANGVQRLGFSSSREGAGRDLREQAERYVMVAQAMPVSIFRAMHTAAPRILNTYVDVPRILRPQDVSSLEFEAIMAGPVPSVEIALGGDSRSVLALAFLSPERKKRLSARDRRLFGMVIAHLGAAARLRSPQGGAQDDSDVEAWLAPSGRVLDARGAAESATTRRSLAWAVQQSERARGALRRSSPEEALALWCALVQAEWSIVDTVERDGKRLVLARRNRPSVPGNVALTESERAVAFFAASAHSHKLMAYELGLSVPAVAHLLRSALTKLGVRSRIELARLYGGGAP